MQRKNDEPEQRRKLGRAMACILLLLAIVTAFGSVACFGSIFDVLGFSSSPYAVTVIGTSHSAPDRAEGPPDEKYASLGVRSEYIVATMGTFFTNGSGADIRVYEVGNRQGGGDEAFDVFISTTSFAWIQVANNVKNDSGSIFASVDISPHAGTYRYIKIVNRSTSGGSTPGADIDAIEVLHQRFSTALILRVLLLVVAAVVIVALTQ